MTCKAEQFEHMEREAKAKHGDKVCDNMFDDLFARVREYAQQRRLEELTRKSRGTPMDIGEANASDNVVWNNVSDNATWNNTWCDNMMHHSPWNGMNNSVDALGKGKG